MSTMDMIKMDDIKAMAKDLGIKAGKKNKTQLIQAIQTAEGNSPCFDTGIKNCEQQDCLWRAMCQ
ncbi:MAG: hypothetical protein JXR70_17435 [Spirochaetales bacterium]|nr:hypothetical protein [Spirochaetales bacterium]